MVTRIRFMSGPGFWVLDTFGIGLIVDVLDGGSV